MKRASESGYAYSVGLEDAVPGDREQVQLSRIWVEAPARWRHEFRLSGSDETTIVVVDGDRWWFYLPSRGATTNHGSPDAPRMPTGFPYQGLFPAKNLLRGIQITRRSRTTMSGSEVEELVGVPRGGLHDDLPRGADHYEIKVELERGIVREVVARAHGSEFERIVVTDVATNISIDPRVFRIDLPPGVTFRAATPPGRAPYPSHGPTVRL